MHAHERAPSSRARAPAAGAREAVAFLQLDAPLAQRAQRAAPQIVDLDLPGGGFGVSGLRAAG
jgi:hypothetical protein